MNKPWDLRVRTLDFAVAIYRFCRQLPATAEARDVVRQLRRAASSVAANCRALKRSQSDAAFVAKTAVIIEEADESGFWLDFLVRIELAQKAAVRPLLTESSELVAIFTASRKTARARLERKRKTRRTETER